MSLVETIAGRKTLRVDHRDTAYVFMYSEGTGGFTNLHGIWEDNPNKSRQERHLSMQHELYDELSDLFYTNIKNR